MQRTRGPVDGFQLAYERTGEGPPVILLHGWPGASSDYREVAKRLDADVIRPDLRGFGESDRHERPADAYSADAQAASVIGLIEELRLDRPVIAGYDIGSRIAQAIARDRPELVKALVLSPPLPGVGARVLEPGPQAEFWYQHFHRLDLAERLIDGDPVAVRAYLEHFWEHWSAPGWTPPHDLLDHLTELYARPGAFVASVQWYRAGAGTVARALQERPPARADRDPDHRAVAGPRPAVPARVVGPPGRVLRGRRPARPPGLRALQPARGAGRGRGGDPRAAGAIAGSDTPKAYNGHMAVLDELAAELGAHERTLRRGLAEGLLRGRRPTPRTVELARGEVAYLRAYWPLLRALREALRSERTVRLAVLIGSAARGAMHEGSDVDLLVDLAGADWRGRDRLRGRLARAAGRPVDLVALDAAQEDPLLLDAALSDGRVLVDRDGQWGSLLARRAAVADAAARAAGTLRAELHALVADLSADA